MSNQSFEGSEADARIILQEIASSVALLPQQPPLDGEPIPEGAIALPVIEQDGTQYVPIFTSETTLAEAGVDAATAVPIPVAQLAAGWPADDLWMAVNPASEGGLTLPPDVVRARCRPWPAPAAELARHLASPDRLAR